MPVYALHTVLKPGAEKEYERVHAQIPPDLDAAMREAGVRRWQIWRDGVHLFHLVECDDFAATREFLREHPANIPWQATMSELLAVADDYESGDNSLPLVWALP
jgi:L-rhamnose mutarotase